MKKLILLLLLTTSFSFCQEIVYHNPFLDLKSGEHYYLHGNDVKFRKLPNTSSEVIDLLKIGSKIEIIEKSKKTLLYNGIESPFYKVKFKNKIGYILGGLISIEKKETENFKYFFAFKRNSGPFSFSLMIRFLNKSLELKEKELKLGNENFTIELYNNKGIEGIENILFINYFAQSCGARGGGVYYFGFENELKKVFEITVFSDSGISWFSEKLIFPNEENGVKDKIVYQRESGISEDEETNWVEIKKTSRELKWENGEITPKIELNK